MIKYIEFVIKYPKSVIVLLALITVGLMTGMPKLKFDNSVEAFLPHDDPAYAFYNATKNIYGDNGRFIIMGVTDEHLWSLETFQHIDDLISDIETYKTFDEPRESARLERFRKIMAAGPVLAERLVNTFHDDRVFQRLVLRKILKNYEFTAILDKDDLEAVYEQLEESYEFKKAEMVDKIISPFTAKDITGENDTLETYDLIPEDQNGKRVLPHTEAQFDEFRQKLLRNPAFDKGIFHRDPVTGKITDFAVIIKFVNLKNQDPISREMLELIQSHKELEITPQGAPVVNIWFNDYLRHDLFTFLPVVMAVVVIIFFFNFRSFRGVALPFFSLGMSTIWILGLMGHLGYKITGLGVSLPALMIAVGSSYSIHILNQYYSDFDLITEKGLKYGLRLSMYHISTTVLLAALTTMVAFVTLATSELAGIKEWGVFSGIGVIFSFVISSSMIPAGLTLMPHRLPPLMLRKNKEVRITLIDRFIRLVTHTAIHHYKAVVMVVLILIGVSVAGLFRVNVESEFLQYFKPDDYIRTSARVIEQKFGGRWGFNILLDSGSAEGVKDVALLKRVERIRDWLSPEKNPQLNIGRTDGFTDIIKTMHMAMNEDNPSYYRIPDNNMDVMDYLEIYSGEDENEDGRVDEFESYVDPDFRTTNLLARFCSHDGKTLGTTETQKILDAVSDYLRQTIKPPYSVRITGFPIMNIKLAHYIITGQMQSLALSLVMIGIIVTLLFARFKAGLLALIPMSVAVTINFGIMGWFGINLDTVTSIIAAITVGIGVDDTIHFLNTFRYYQSEGLGLDETIRRTLAVSGKAIIYTSLALVFGFLVLIISSFKPVLLFGILMGITMVATTIGALLILPSVIKITGGDLQRKESQSRIWRYIELGKIFGLERY